MSKKIGFDFGFSDTKIAIISDDGQPQWFKETNAITRLGDDKVEKVLDEGDSKNIVVYNGSRYLVGKSALQYPDASVMNIMDYESIKSISPILAKKYLTVELIQEYDKIAFTLSSAFMKYSKDYKEFMAEELGIDINRIRLVPQGAGCKIAIDKIGLDPNNASLKNSYKDYIILDIGFNTIDVCCVIDGRLMPEDIKGHEHEGIVKVAEKVVAAFKEKYDLDISVPRARQIIYEKFYKKRHETFDATEIVEKAILEYLDELKFFIEKFYGQRLDYISNVILLGGGAEVIRGHKAKWESLFGKGDFVVLPASEAEYYNAIGACLKD
jgi:hypothetical protein